MQSLPTLRLTQHVAADQIHSIAIELLNVGPRQTAEARCAFALSAQQQRDLSWYFEALADQDDPLRAAQVERDLAAVGVDLFRQIFAADGPHRLWAKVSERLADFRIEIVNDAGHAAELPWELLRDPFTDTSLALHARSFVRADPGAVRQASAVQVTDVVRILLVISRTRRQRGGEVAFRPIALRLLNALDADTQVEYRLTVLRPPTFERLAQVLRDAKARGTPFQIVHFDGHGVHADGANTQGYLAFEQPGQLDQARPVSGLELGNLLIEADVPLLILNACRSAYAPDRAISPPQAADDDSAMRVRAFGSLAQQVMLQGVTGAVAMRYNITPDTAARFVAELYRTLTQGRTLGEAATVARKLLDQQIARAAGQSQRQDWPVPVVYEAHPAQIFPTPVPRQSIRLRLSDMLATQDATLDPLLPAEPDIGFHCYDETLLNLDRSFDMQPVVLLHAAPDLGKTVTAAEFARWYARTGGLEHGTVLYTPFTQVASLDELFDTVARVFAPVIQQEGIRWESLALIQKQSLTLQVLGQIPVLWLWDGIEQTEHPGSANTPLRQTAVDFLRRAIRQTKTKFLLTSQHAEQALLGDLPTRIALPELLLADLHPLAAALAARYGIAYDKAAWRPLLVQARAQPHALIRLMRAALQAGVRNEQQVRQFLETQTG